MTTPQRVLLIGHDAAAARSIERALARGGYGLTPERVDTAAALGAALTRQTWDVIVCDWVMPLLSALEALALIKEHNVDAPVIIVSGERGEDVAVAAMQAGAHEVIGKRELTRLATVVERELRAAAARRARMRAEEELRARLDLAVAGAKAGSWDWDLRTGRSEYSSSWLRLLGYAQDELRDGMEDWLTLVHPDDRSRLGQHVGAYLLNPSLPYEIEFRVRHKDGSYRWVLSRASAVHDHDGKVGRLLGLHFDITDRKRVEEEKAALFEIATDIHRSLDFADMLDCVQRRTAARLPCDRVVIYRWDVARTVYRAIAWHGIPPDLVADTAAGEFRHGERIVDGLIAGETVLINDVAGQTWVPAEMLGHFRLTALVLVPLVVRGHKIGALAALNAESGQPFRPHQIELLEGIAQQVGGAMETHEVHQAQQEQAAVSDALARVGQELMSSLSTPVMLDRLCELTAEVLGCDYSHTWLWQPHEEAFAAVSGWGETPEHWEIIRLVKLSRSVLAPQLQRLEREGIVNTKISDLGRSRATEGAREYGATVSLMVPLRRGGELLGFHTAGYRGREALFDARHERIARGIAHLASLALENARLVEELQRANRLKSDFVAAMSHELRTPLNIIMGYNDLLLDEGFGPVPPEQADVLRRTQKSAENLLELINATLDIGRLEAGQSLLKLQEIDLARLLLQIDAETPRLREKPTVSVVWDVAADLPRLHTDSVKLKVVLKNLVDNAIKFTEQGSVVVGARVRDEGVEISVADTGIGIAPDVLPIIFEPFRQGESVMTRHYGGVGLGLYIVRRLLDLLGGTIDVESRAGRGSRFQVWLPFHTDGGLAREAPTHE